MLLATKLKNAVKRLDPDGLIEPVGVRNIVVNGQRRGCSGHFVHKVTGNVVEINTEHGSLGDLDGRILCRYSDSVKDWRGGRNQWIPEKEFAAHVVAMLADPNKKVNDCRHVTWW